MGVYIIVAIWSILFCAYRLLYSGLSKEAKRLVMKRHVFWILSFILTNSYLMYLNVQVIYVQFTNSNISDSTNTDLVHTSNYSYFYDA